MINSISLIFSAPLLHLPPFQSRKIFFFFYGIWKNLDSSKLWIRKKEKEVDLPVKFQLDSTSHAVNPIDHSVRWRSTIDDSTCTKFVKQSHSRDNHLISTSPSGNFSSLFPVLFTFSPFQRNSVHALLTWNQDRSRRSIFPSILGTRVVDWRGGKRVLFTVPFLDEEKESYESSPRTG